MRKHRFLALKALYADALHPGLKALYADALHPWAEGSLCL